MNIAILDAGKPPARLIERFGTYADMFVRLLGRDAVAATYDVTRRQFPEQPSAHDAYLITGSPAGVHEPLPWIGPLKGFLRAARGQAKLVGICFGHQIMAEAFGGRVQRSDKGWGVGLQRYRILEREPWMDDVEEVALPVSHQDQVVEQPPHTTLIAANSFCEIGGLAYRDQPAMSFQFHPEFEPEFAAALIELMRDRLAAPDEAIASLQAPNDRERLARWIRSFVQDG
ncbi:MAG: glutamine amidotransferase-related protein [Sphingomonadales bacterium]